MKEILELTLTLSLTGLAVTTYTLIRLSRLILELRIQIAEMTLPTPVACVEEEQEDEILYDSDFDERIREMTEELEKLNTPGTLYDLPHASVRTPSKFSPEYAD